MSVRDEIESKYPSFVVIGILNKEIPTVRSYLCFGAFKIHVSVLFQKYFKTVKLGKFPNRYNFQ